MDDYKIDELTRYLKPVQEMKPTDFEILQALIRADIDPEEISSVTRLRGSRSGVIRVRMKTRNSVDILDNLVKRKKLNVSGVVLGPVSECGHFVKVLLENVPMCITDSDVEEEMRKYGHVIKSEKQYMDYEGCRIANEKRTVLFSSVMKGTSLQNARIPICGSTVFSSIIAPSTEQKQQQQKQKNHKTAETAELSQISSARRKSFGAVPFYLDGNQGEEDLKDDWLSRLQRRRSFKVKQPEGQMSSVAYRQSTVVRDVEKLVGVGGYDILTSRDLKGHQLGSNVVVSKVSANTDRLEMGKKKCADRNKLSWLKAFDKRIMSVKSGSKLDKKDKNNVNLIQDQKPKNGENLEAGEKKLPKIKITETPIQPRTTPIQLNTTLKPTAESKSPKKVNWIQGKIPEINMNITSLNVATKKTKSCNETFANFLELRRKQKRAEAFEQLSAHLI